MIEIFPHFVISVLLNILRVTKRKTEAVISNIKSLRKRSGDQASKRILAIQNLNFGQGSYEGCDHRSKSLHEPVEDQKEHLIFLNGASYQVQQSVMEDHGTNEYGACKLEYDWGRLHLAVIQAFHHHPCPLVGTCRHGSVPSGQKSCMHRIH